MMHRLFALVLFSFFILPFSFSASFREGLPADLDESTTAPERLSRHVAPLDRLPYFTPAPGRTDGRVYYFVPDGIDFAKPAPLLVFLHGGDASSPRIWAAIAFAWNRPTFGSLIFCCRTGWVICPSLLKWFSRTVGSCLPGFFRGPAIAIIPRNSRSKSRRITPFIKKRLYKLFQMIAKGRIA